MRVDYSYLPQQFEDSELIFADLRELVASSEFTLGPYVERFEKKFAEYIGVRHAIGTNSGTDALILALKSLDVGPGDEVITVPNTFIATVGAIVDIGAIPVFVDCNSHLQMDPGKIEAAITPKTKVLLPVHWAGWPAEIEEILNIAELNGLKVVEDACPAAGAEYRGRRCGTFGQVSAFSLHPLKPLNVWGDGGVVVTDDDDVAAFLRLYGNHGLQDRDHAVIWGVNRRLQPFQAIVGTRQLDTLEQDINARRSIAAQLDKGFGELSDFITVPPRSDWIKGAYHMYILRAQRRDELVEYLHSKQVDCKVHYPVPLHLQAAASGLGYGAGDFPECEAQAGEVLSLPAHQYVSDEQVDYMVECISTFYLA